MAVLAALAGGYFSALQLSLQEFSRGELEDRLGRHQHGRVDWLMRHLDGVTLAAAVLRRVSAVVLMASVLAGMVVHGGGTVGSLIGASVGVFAWLWLVEIGLAWAISDHVATPFVGASIRILPVVHYAMLPLTLPLDWINEVVRRLVGAEEERDDLEEELRHVMEESEREGHLSEIEKEMIEAIVDFRTATVGEVMTPRIDITGIEVNSDLAAIKQIVIEEGHSRYPVYEGNLDHILGILYVKDLLAYVGCALNEPEVGDQGSGVGGPGPEQSPAAPVPGTHPVTPSPPHPAPFDLRSLLRTPVVVPESRRISDLLIEFQQQRVHMAIVLDEYGGTAGLVTIEDIVEEIVGEIRDEHDIREEPEPEITQNEDGTIDVDGRIRINELNDELDLSLPEDEDYDTVAGWVFANVGRIPSTDETFRFGGLEVKIVEVDRTRLKRIKLRILKGEEAHIGAEANGAK